MHTVSVNTRSYGTVTATWQRKGRMIIVRFGDREKLAQASDNLETNNFVARDILRGWIAEELKDDDVG